MLLMDTILLASGTALVGLCVALAAHAGSDSIGAGLAFVEDDLRDKLRRLRVNTRNLRKWIVAWAIAVLAALLGFSIALDSIPFGVMLAILIVCIPWYIVRRMAERRRLRIEDQLADAMVSLASAIKAGLSLGQALEILA